jgi:hypothetical protein
MAFGTGRGGAIALASTGSAVFRASCGRRVIRFHLEQNMHSMIGKSRLFGAVFLGLLSGGVVAQGRTLSAHDYAQAERFMVYNTAPLVDHAVQKVSWLDDGHFWYRDHDSNGDHFVQMDAASGKTSPLFDQAKLAAALGKVTGKPVDA